MPADRQTRRATAAQNAQRVQQSFPSIAGQIQQVTMTRSKVLSDSTRTGYTGQQKAFFKWCQDQELIPPENTVDEVTLDTPTFIQAFISFKCESNNRSYKTAEQIRSALKSYYKRELLRPDGWEVPENGTVPQGNPCDDSQLLDYVKGLRKIKHRENEFTKGSSLPMLYKSLLQIKNHVDDDDVEIPVAERKWWAAVSSLAFFCLFRCDEVLTLKGAHLVRNLRTIPPPGCPETLFHSLTVTFRKTNQDDPEAGTMYEIHPNPREPAANAFQHLSDWLQYMEDSGHPIKDDDYIFPKIHDGRIHFGVQMQQPKFVELIQKHAKNAGCELVGSGSFTTHCFRRGGAQHRFMYAEEKWGLVALKWWGGWAGGESQGTILRYLLEEYSRYESGYSDMFSPYRRDKIRTTFMGAAGTPTVSQIQQVVEEARTSIEANLTNQLRDLQIRMENSIKELLTHNHHHPGALPAAENPVPIPVAVVPAVVVPADPQTLMQIPDAADWKIVMRQWTIGQPEKHLTVPLQDWTAEMRNASKAIKALYSKRKTVALEVVRLGGEPNFARVYGQFAATGTLAKLQAEIRRRASARRAEPYVLLE